MAELLVKKSYLHEMKPLTKNTYSLGDKGEDVKRIQELFYMWQLDTNVTIEPINPDGIWGAKTEEVVRALQPELEIPADGIITNEIFQKLLLPFKSAFSLEYYTKTTIREKVVFFAKMHLQYRSCEINQLNLGPWVRSYMGGYDGPNWYWCQGFVCTILDQAFSSEDKKFTDYYSNTFRCEDFRQNAKSKNLLFTYQDFLDSKITLQAGDMGHIISSKKIASHVFIIVDVLDAKKGIVQTIEGNTNFGGSRNGTGVFMRIRTLCPSIEIVQCITK